MELEEKGFKVCFYMRDFVPGTPILCNIDEALVRSKRTLCLVTDNFLRSEYCMLEFRGAMEQCLERKHHRLIVIKWPNIELDDANDSNREMKMFLSTHVYIDREEEDYMNKLLYALPVGRLGRHNVDQQNEHSENANDDDDVALLRD